MKMMDILSRVCLDSSEITDVTFIVVNNNSSILAVGWDKYVNVFNDDQERNKQLCYPEDQFGGDETNEGHQEDILCIARSSGDLIATGDYGGTILIWNMSSKKIFAVLKDEKENQQIPEGKCRVLSIVFRETFVFVLKKIPMIVSFVE